MRSICLDQSSSNCIGFAVIENGKLATPSSHGIIEPIDKKASFGNRMRSLYMDTRKLIEWALPQEIIFEDIHYLSLKSKEAVESIAGATTICEMLANEYALLVHRVSPKTWQSACGAKGRKSAEIKEDVQHIMCHRWGMQKQDFLSYDHSDAMGIAAWWIAISKEHREGAMACQ